MRLWSRCAKEGRTPTPDEIAEARAAIDRPAWRLDPAAMTAEQLSDVPLTLNAIAKGYIVERACAAAMSEGGIRGVLLNVGGDMRVVGAIDRTIGIADPRADSETSSPLAHFAVGDKAVSTSGNSQRGFRINGHWYSHKLDPATGRTGRARRLRDGHRRSVRRRRRPRHDLQRARARGERPPGADDPGRRMPDRRGRRRITRSDGWGRYERPASGPLANRREGQQRQEAAAGKSNTWGDAFELLLKLEINRPNTGKRRYQRPYLAVWVEDKDGYPVRTLDALGHGEQARLEMDPRPEALVSQRPGPAAGRRQRPGRHHRAADPRRPASTTSSGTARTTGENQLQAASTPCPSRPRRARDVPEHPARSSGSAIGLSPRNSRETSRSRRRRSNTGGRRRTAGR